MADEHVHTGGPEAPPPGEVIHLPGPTYLPVVTAAGGSLESIVRTTVFLADLNDFAEMNEVYGSFFGENPPARSTVEVRRLPAGRWLLKGKDKSHNACSLLRLACSGRDGRIASLFIDAATAPFTG